MDVISHRGLTRGGSPENTLAAFDEALRLGAAGVELDVRLCADNVAVVCHDPGLRRVAGVEIDLAAVQHTVAREVAAAAGHALPLFEEAVDLVAGRGVLVVDVKGDAGPPGAVAAAAAAVLHARPLPPEQVVISSFDPHSLEVFAELAPWYPRALLTGLDVGVGVGVERVLAAGHQGVHPFVRAVAGDAAGLARARQRGLAVRVWTVNDPATAGWLRDGDLADAVISDDPVGVAAAPAPSS